MSRLGTLSIAAALAGGLAAGCAPVLQNPAREPGTQVPASFTSEPPAQAAGVGQQPWKQFFNDPDLDALIDGALVNNQELNIRQQEILIAQSEVMARNSEYRPRLGAVAGAGAERVGEDTSQGVSDEANELSPTLGRFRAGFQASWEIDAWKRLRNLAKAAGYRYLASVEGRNFAVTEIVAEIASSYYEVLALDNQLDVLRANIAIQQSALDVVRIQKDAARATELAVQRFEAEVLKNQSRQFVLEQQRVRAENRISLLMGRYPKELTPSVDKFKAPLDGLVATGIPSELLDNRPDVKQAALDLEAAKLDVKAARAAFYPALSIDGFAGYDAFNLKHLFRTPGSLAFDVAGNMVAPLLNRNAIKAQYNMANAQQLQAVYNYERALLTAFTEVATQLSVIDRLSKSYALQQRQVETLTAAIDVSNLLFQAARADYGEVLLTRRDALDAQMELIETKNQQLQARVRAFQALGGGWR